MDLLTMYVIGMIVLMGMFALRSPHENCSTVFVLGLIWPLSIVLIVFMVILTFTSWNFEVVKGTKMFGFRKPTNSKARGFAVTVFGEEVQLFKVVK
jgi:hypothetical protein